MSLPVRLADLVQGTLVPQREAQVADHGARPGFTAGPDGGPAVDGRDAGESAQLSALLAELAHIPDADVDADWLWAPRLAQGDVVGKFVIQRELGRGGFGVVYEALDRVLLRAVAFKVVRPGTRRDGEVRVKAEAEALARLNHPNVVTLHDVGRCRAGPYLVFELLRGVTLAERLRAGPLALRDAVDVAVDVARVLAHAHRAGVVHRDLKPANVFLGEDGAVKVLDFGLAHLFGHAAVEGGTPAYMAPEQWRSEPGDARTDLFALGVLLHQMLSGALPYRVSRDRSEALEPGPAPLLSRRAAPAPLRVVVARLLAKDPAARPQTAQEALDALLPVQRRLEARAGTRLRRGVVAAVVAAAAAFAAWLVPRALAPHDTVPSLVVVADVENETGEPAVGGISGLLVTALEQSHAVKVLSRARTRGLLGQLGREPASRIDADVGRELARVAGARVLLLASARREGEGYALRLRGVDVSGGAELFAAPPETVGDRAAIPDAVDRLVARAREALGERSADVRAASVRLREAVTPSVEAYAHFFEGQECIDSPSRGGSWAAVGSCAEHFRQALELDPTFALAYYQLAFLLETEDGPRDEIAAHMASALRYVARVPQKEARLIRAWKAHVDGDDEGALALYGEVLAGFPEDRQALYLAGDLHFHRGEWSAAEPFLRKLLAVDPAAEWPLDHLVHALALAKRDQALRELVEDVRAQPATPARTHAIVRGLVWLDGPAAALEAARRGVEAGHGPSAEWDLVHVLLGAGDFAAAEELLARRVAADPGDLPAGALLANAVAAQGRRAEALRLLDALARRAGPDEGLVRYVRALLVAGDASPAVAWRAAALAREVAPRIAANLAVVLALRGDLAKAAELADGLPPDSPAARQLAALVLWRSGDAAGAAARLAALEARDPSPEQGLAPAYLLAEVAGGLDDPAATLQAVERFQRLWPRGMWRSWAYPRSVYLGALARERTGDRAGARRDVERLLELWGRADPGLPLLREARALRARLR